MLATVCLLHPTTYVLCEAIAFHIISPAFLPIDSDAVYPAAALIQCFVYSPNVRQGYPFAIVAW